jgi:hypothetical protein
MNFYNGNFPIDKIVQRPEQGMLVLNSWKEIATYMGRGVRTVQRWEAKLSLPVHRVGASYRSPVIGFGHELDRWLSVTALSPAASAIPLPQSERPAKPAGSELADLNTALRSHLDCVEELKRSSRELIATVAFVRDARANSSESKYWGLPRNSESAPLPTRMKS